jgi:hypothetical protein
LTTFRKRNGLERMTFIEQSNVRTTSGINASELRKML